MFLVWCLHTCDYLPANLPTYQTYSLTHLLTAHLPTYTPAPYTHLHTYTSLPHFLPACPPISILLERRAKESERARERECETERVRERWKDFNVRLFAFCFGCGLMSRSFQNLKTHKPQVLSDSKPKAPKRCFRAFVAHGSAQVAGNLRCVYSYIPTVHIERKKPKTLIAEEALSPGPMHGKGASNTTES